MEKIYFKSDEYEIRKKEKLKQLKEELNNKSLYKQIHMINNDEKIKSRKRMILEYNTKKNKA